MNEPDRGSVVLVDLTYSDQKQSKLRPALVISDSALNRVSRDVIVMKITSKEPRFRKVTITTSVPDLSVLSVTCRQMPSILSKKRSSAM